MNRYLKANRMINSLINEGEKKFILYPFGEQGMMIKRILNERYGIQEMAIVDNKLADISDNSKVISLDKLNEMDTNDIKVLLTSDNEEIYSEIRYDITKYISLENLIDVFSYSMYFDKQVYYDQSDFCMDPRVSALETAARDIYKNIVGGGYSRMWCI